MISVGALCVERETQDGGKTEIKNRFKVGGKDLDTDRSEGDIFFFLLY